MKKVRKNQKGYTLLELMMVIGIMTVVSIGVMNDRMAETRQLKAKMLGREIATFAMGMQSYTSYYSGITSGAGVPVNGTIKKGVNFLKSNACLSGGNIETTSAGALEIGFVPFCGFLSNLNDANKNEKTTMGSLGFSTKFERHNASNGYGSHLTSITAIDVYKGGTKNQIMMEESGLAALVAGGLSDGRAGGATTAGYRVTYCLPGTAGKSSVSNEIRKMCTGNDNKIVIMTSTDSSADLWLRTDGKNTMNNIIQFNPGVGKDLRAISNINKLILPSGANTLAIEKDKKIIVDIDQTKVDVVDANLTVKGKGYIMSENTIVATKGLQAKVLLPYLGKGKELQTTSTYQIEIDKKSELNQVGLNGIYFGTNAGSRAGNGANANITAIPGNNKSLSLNADMVLNKADVVKFQGKSQSHTSLKGNTQVGGMNVRMSNGSYKSISQLLPRYTLLGVTRVMGNGSTKVSKSTYERMGCARGSLKPILVAQGWNMQGFFATDARWIGITVSGNPGSSSPATAGYTVTDPHKFISYAEGQAYVNDHGTYWTATIDGYSRYSNHSQKGHAKNRYGVGLMHVYCLNDIDKSVPADK